MGPASPSRDPDLLLLVRVSQGAGRRTALWRPTSPRSPGAAPEQQVAALDPRPGVSAAPPWRRQGQDQGRSFFVLCPERSMMPSSRSAGHTAGSLGGAGPQAQTHDRLKSAGSAVAAQVARNSMSLSTRERFGRVKALGPGHRVDLCMPVGDGPTEEPGQGRTGTHGRDSPRSLATRWITSAISPRRISASGLRL